VRKERKKRKKCQKGSHGLLCGEIVRSGTRRDGDHTLSNGIRTADSRRREKRVKKERAAV